MAQANKIIELKGGRKAEIRSFIKNKDRRKIQRVALAGVEYTEQDIERMQSEDGKMKFMIPREALIDTTSEQVRCLLVAYDGNTLDPFEALEESPNEDDWEKISEAVGEIFDEDDKDSSKKSKPSA